MRRYFSMGLLIMVLPLVAGPGTSETKTRGVLLENHTWLEAEKLLTPATVVVFPLGAEAKEHGPHLKLNNDWLMAEYLKKRVLAVSNVVIAPTINYSFYPAFLEYPGSTSLRLETARDVIVDLCRTLAHYGPRRFYVINTGVSTLEPLKLAAELLKQEGIVLRYTDILSITEPVEKAVSQQQGGTHADEIETSMMLYIAPVSVDMKKAVKDYNPDRPGPLVRNPKEEGTYSPTGIWGDPTLATREKGRKITEAFVLGILAEIEEVRRSPVPPQ
jgi:creatinine amidohydrolase